MTYPPNPAPSGTGDPGESPEWTSQGQGSGGQYEQSAAYRPANDKLNPLAVAALIFGLTGCLSLGGLVFGITALRQIRQDGGRGRGLAIAGAILGGVVNGVAAILVIVSFAVGS